ncbi:MAG: hypothetical protein PHV37_04440 [Candidatus Gastranaerophilales bacterium]|nr:hypothetical protein [Candidatus Gastranaerophilales bacterium]
MKKELKLRGHIIDSLVLSKLLDQLAETGVECYTIDVKIGSRRKDVSEATFLIDAPNEAALERAIEISEKQGAFEI